MKASQAIAKREEEAAKEQLRRAKKAELDAIQAQIDARKSRVIVRQRELEADRKRVETDLARFRQEEEAKARLKRMRILKDKAELEADRQFAREIAEREKAQILAEDRCVQGIEPQPVNEHLFQTPHLSYAITNINRYAELAFNASRRKFKQPPALRMSRS